MKKSIIFYFHVLFYSDDVGKEIVSRITTNINSEDSFYTDANGRQTLKRTLNKRQTWKYKITEPVSGNYYPINSHIFIKESAGDQLTLLVDRAQGGSSLNSGEIELMVHRRLLVDDGFGVGESLNEMAYHRGLVVRGKHYLILSPEANSARIYRSLSQELYREPQISFTATNESFETWLKLYKTEVIADALKHISIERIINNSFSKNLNSITSRKRHYLKISISWQWKNILMGPFWFAWNTCMMLEKMMNYRNPPLFH